MPKVNKTRNGAPRVVYSHVWWPGPVVGPRLCAHLHLHTQPGWPSGEPVDVLIPQPEIPTDAAKALLVLLPVPVEGDEATLSSLNDGPAAACHLHVTEHLVQKGRSCQGPTEAGAGVWGGPHLPSPTPAEPGMCVLP